MYTTPYILAHAPPVPSLISRNTGISIAQSTDFIYIQKHKQYSLHRLRQPTNNSYNNVISTGTDVLFQFYNVCTSFKNIQSGTNFLESGCWQDDVWSAVPFIPPSGKEHTFSIYHVLFSFSLKNMRISGNNIQVQMFDFDSNTTVPLKCVPLVVWKAYVDRLSFGWLFLGIPIKF